MKNMRQPRVGKPEPNITEGDLKKEKVLSLSPKTAALAPSWRCSCGYMLLAETNTKTTLQKVTEQMVHSQSQNQQTILKISHTQTHEQRQCPSVPQSDKNTEFFSWRSRQPLGLETRSTVGRTQQKQGEKLPLLKLLLRMAKHAARRSTSTVYKRAHRTMQYTSLFCFCFTR